ncbi:DUF3160 domain-containing protein [Candidatus Thiodictyon syntrophicum]|jgi:hypothetical protein|uniref:DUF3160 domain-containing protein n=1 Tax=Candidatus Thiodictyon syntrophicum TaxID=1166950 RepID=A0A2K8UHE4_9GAMM|nr:DUF3160 domain-containing protein [Candidatus Thiodictyon syntrophicum]AUB85006.1 hypothetical protein THSYN_29115 [Candidatus Thiodictyon syntrophicum]
MKPRHLIALIVLTLLGGPPAPGTDLFDPPQLAVSPSPAAETSLALDADETVIDTDVSPAGATVAALVRRAGGGQVLRFWTLDGTRPVADRPLPDGFTARALAWHPRGERLFLAGTQGGEQVIAQVAADPQSRRLETIYRSPQKIRRLMVGPRPFETGRDGAGNPVLAYRLFFGLKGADGRYAIRSITEDGRRGYQAIGPKGGFTRFADAAGPPSEIAADWALPLGFHPGGHLLLWEDQGHRFHVATYAGDHWAGTRDLLDNSLRGGSVTVTPNGLGLIQWQPGSTGVTVILDRGQRRSPQCAGHRFDGTPSSVPDGRGLVGVERTDSGLRLVYCPITVPLADVTNAWLFAQAPADRDLIERRGGLLRDLDLEQVYSLYESESYALDQEGGPTPARPYLVTTDIFWELLAAAYEGLFITTERHQSIPAFWDLVAAADRQFRTAAPASPWARVFATLAALRDPTSGAQDPEVALIQRAQGVAQSPALGIPLTYGELLPRGHYSADPEFQNYFKAFTYLTKLAPKGAPVAALQDLPSALRAAAARWVSPYRAFIAPSRAPLVWGDRGTLPAYARHPADQAALFPLSWGFDNEVLLATVFHPDWPEAEQITGPAGPRILPSALDLAAALGSPLASSLLRNELDRYPRLRPVLAELGQRHAAGTGGDLYNRWIDALAMQWAGDLKAPDQGDGALWQAKRLQTGLASWATLRHATVLVNERVAAEGGESGFENIVFSPPRGAVEPDPRTFEAIATLFDLLQALVDDSAGLLRGEMATEDGSELEPLRQAVSGRLHDTADQARRFKAMAERQDRGEGLSGADYEAIYHVARVAEHHFLVFKSLANKELALSNPDPMPKIADVAGDGPYLMAAVGRPMEWDQVVPFYGRRQLVKGAVYSFYEFASPRLLDDAAWRQMLGTQAHPAWIAPFVSRLGLPDGDPF